MIRIRPILSDIPLCLLRKVPSLTCLPCILILSLLSVGTAHSQTGFSLEKEPVIRDLNWLNNNFLSQQRERYINLFTSRFGKRPTKSRRDLFFLQQLVDKKVLRKEDTLELQSLGVLLGDIILKEQPRLSWMVYEDDLGKSHALCALKNKYCLFPITMLSRRIERGVTPDVSAIYDNALQDVEDGLALDVKR